MNYDITLMNKANVIFTRAAMPDIDIPREHMGQPVARSFQLRQVCSAWFYRMAERIAPRPAETGHDELFAAIPALLAEPRNELPTLDSVSQ